MFSQQEDAFMKHWERVRESHSRFASKLYRGLPMAILFSLPVLISVALVYFFSPEWYTKISQAAAGSSTVLLVAVFGIILFFSYFRMHFKWEMNEQLYEELKSREKQSNAG